jgi:uncharacterized membrane protein YoaK (UPF0700 family)
VTRSPARFERQWVALLLAAVGGAVDGVGFLVLHHLFTAHMSGNSIAAAAYAGLADWKLAAHRIFPIPVFIVGVVLGALVRGSPTRNRGRPVLAAALVVEAAFLLAFTVAASGVAINGEVPREPAWRFYLLAALPALAMGVQNATLRRVGAVHIRTTFITGMLTNAAEEAVSCFVWVWHRLRGHSAGRVLRVLPRRSAFGRMVLYAAIWLGYVAGAVVAVCGLTRFGVAVLAVPVGALLVIAVADVLRPISPPTNVAENE